MEAKAEFINNKLVLIPTEFCELNKSIAKGIDTFTFYEKDIRAKSGLQNKKIHAILNDIAAFVGENSSNIKLQMKIRFTLETGKKLESVAEIDMTTACEFISFLLEFAIENEIPLSFNPIEMCDDIERYIYICLKFKKCCICGRQCDLHHVDHVGMGNDRTEIHNLGRRALPLCRAHHTDLHTKGDNAFMELNHLVAVKLDKKLCQIYKLKI